MRKSHRKVNRILVVNTVDFLTKFSTRSETYGRRSVQTEIRVIKIIGPRNIRDSLTKETIKHMNRIEKYNQWCGLWFYSCFRLMTTSHKCNLSAIISKAHITWPSTALDYFYKATPFEINI